VSNFRIIYLNLEPELLISNWTPELSILLLRYHICLKKKKDFEFFAVVTCITQIGYGPNNDGCCMKNYFILYRYVHAYMHA